ncbi:MAG: PIG-L family deacetylase, partial [Gammaproteobacteria bacterium]|nr:PIG-L family deacetylase [Gammaproteobacteria bacterium]
GIATHVVFVTDGALGGEGNREALVKERMKEATLATAELQVDEIYFFGESDRGLALTDQLLKKTEELLRRVRPRSIFIPTPMEYHPDHRVTAELGWQAAGRISDSPIDVYSYEISTLAPINVLIDVSEVADKKYEVVKMYASQLTQAKYLALVQAVDTARTFSLPIDRAAAEGFFHFTDREATLQEQVQRCVTDFFRGVGSAEGSGSGARSGRQESNEGGEGEPALSKGSVSDASLNDDRPMASDSANERSNKTGAGFLQRLFR